MPISPTAVQALLLVTLALPYSSAEAQTTQQPLLLPIPKKYTMGATTRTFSSTMQVVGTQGGADATAAFNRFKANVFRYPSEGTATGLTVKYTIANTSVSTTKQFGVDESYTLTVPLEGDISITSETIFGMYYALETLSQMLQYDTVSGQYTISGAPWYVEDSPRFKHRGVMIDTSRHFMPPAVLKRVIDGLAYCKLNVFHWHMVDMQSFPYVSKKYPNSVKGALDPRLTYNAAIIKDIVEYARQRGVRMVVEIDQPGHAGSIFRGFPELRPSVSASTPCGTIDVTKDTSYEIMVDLWEELAGLFPDDWQWWGGDEVTADCWENDTNTVEFAKEHGITNLVDLEGYYFNRAGELADKRAALANKKRVYWTEAWWNGGSKSNGTQPASSGIGLNRDKSIVALWVAKNNAKGIQDFKALLEELIAAGVPSIYMPDWYGYYWDHNTTWDRAFDEPSVQPWIHPGNRNSSAYTSDPCGGLSDELCEKWVLGAEGAVWTDHIDGSSLERYTFPRAIGLAEKLWSPKEATADVEKATPRVRWFRCVLNDRGINAFVTNIGPDGVLPMQSMSCFDQ